MAVSLVFLSLMLLSAAGPSVKMAAAQGTPIVRANSATLLRGQNGTMTLDLIALGGENAVGFSLNFDPSELGYVSAATGTGAVGASLIVNTSQTGLGRVGISIARSPGSSFAAGTHQIVVVTFAVLSSGTQASTNIGFGDQPVPREIVDVNAMFVSGSFQGTTLTIDNPCTYTITPVRRHFSAAGGTGTVGVTTSTGCGWSVTNNTPFASVTGGFNGNGNGTVTFQVDPNVGVSRSGTINIAGKTFTVRQGARFADVTEANFFYEFIGKLSAAGVTTGCGTNAQGELIYCPGDSVTREQMAAFIMRALGEFNPPQPAMQRFVDVPPANFFYAFIDRLATVGVTTGCNPPTFTQYCPGNFVTREQMAAFLMRALGEFNPPQPAMQRFVDVPPANFFYAFIDRLAIVGVTTGCNPPQFTQYCPALFVNREQMAAFLVRAFGL